MSERSNCLSYWFSKIQFSVPVPKTIIIPWEENITGVLDGEKEAGESLEKLVNKIVSQIAFLNFQYPLFLRTGQGSGKHDWKRTCLIEKESDFPSHIAALIEWSYLVDFFGLAHDVWVVREMLPVEPITICDNYRGMPLVKEARGFVRNGIVECAHPYWPLDAIKDGINDKDNAELYFKQAHPGNSNAEWLDPLKKVAEIFKNDGYWSVDAIATKKGWFVTDMAFGERSFHYPNCEVRGL